MKYSFYKETETRYRTKQNTEYKIQKSSKPNYNFPQTQHSRGWSLPILILFLLLALFLPVQLYISPPLLSILSFHSWVATSALCILLVCSSAVVPLNKLLWSTDFPSPVGWQLYSSVCSFLFPTGWHLAFLVCCHVSPRAGWHLNFLACSLVSPMLFSSYISSSHIV